MNKWSYAVTFESPESQPPETRRGSCAAGSASTALARAFREAQKTRLGKRWESVVVLLERGKAAETPTL